MCLQRGAGGWGVRHGTLCLDKHSVILKKIPHTEVLILVTINILKYPVLSS